MERHMKNKRLLTGLFALSAGLILASCDPVSAVPKSYNEPIVVNNDGSNIDLKDNILGTLYDSITSDRNEKVLSKLLEKIAESKFGTYSELLAAENDKASFIAKYSEYFGTDELKEARFDEFKKDVETRISEYFYNEITSGSYNDDLGRFSEEKLYKAHRYELYDMLPMTQAVVDNKFFIDETVTKETAFSKLKGEYYNPNADTRGYIEEKVYPDILKNKLVEDYIYKNNASSLGRAYARKISFVKVSYENSPASMSAMMKEFAKTYIKDAELVADDKSNEAIDFELINYALKGYTKFDFTAIGSNIHYLVNCLDNAAADPLSKEAKVNKLLNVAYGEPADDPNYDSKVYVKVAAEEDDESDYAYKTSGIYLVEPGLYRRETKLGKILESYEKALIAEGQRFPSENYKKELDSFTENGKSKQYGLMQKILSLAKEDNTTDGWFVKNGGATELPSALRDRLFNIKVANVLDDLPIEEDGVTPRYDKKNYVRNIQGRKVVLPKDAKAYSDAEPFNYVYEDPDGKAFYICQVMEAPSTLKLAESSTTYSKLDKENISRQIAKILGTKDSYIKDAYTEILNKYTFTFYDSDLLNYFKEEYPDLDQFSDD